MSTAVQTTPKSAAEVAKDSKRITLRRLFESQRPELAKLLPKGMTLERLERMALTECVKNPKLFDCTAESWALALQTCTAQGLYPDSGLGYMYLIPRRKGRKEAGVREVLEVHAQRGYQGDMKLWRNTGEVSDVWAEVVYEKDKYKVTKGTERSILHEPYEGTDDPGPLKACYAVAKLKDGTTAFVTLTKRDVMRHKAASTADTDDADSPWKKHEAAMWQKTAIHELNKWMPKDSEKAELAAGEIAGLPRLGPAIDIDAVTIPLGEEKPALEALTDQLAEQNKAATTAMIAGQASVEGPCEHPGLTPEVFEILEPGAAATCKDCGELVEKPKAEPIEVKEAGPGDIKETVEALSGAAPKRQPGRRLE